MDSDRRLVNALVPLSIVSVLVAGGMALVSVYADATFPRVLFGLNAFIFLVMAALLVALARNARRSSGLESDEINGDAAGP